MLITSRLSDHARSRPHQMALSCGSHRLSYSALEVRVTSLAALFEYRTSVNAHIGLLLENSCLFIESFLAAARSGRAAMVLDPTWTPAQLDSVLGDHAPEVLIVADDMQSRIPLGFPVANIILASELQDIPVQYPDHKDRETVDPEAIFYIGFTSGTTGAPKGFQRSHRSWVASFEGDRHEFNIGHNDHVLSPGPLVHSLFLYAVINGLFAGASVDILPRPHEKTILDLISTSATHLYVVPAMMAGLCQRAEISKKFSPGQTLKAILSGGAKWSPEQQEKCAELFPSADRIEFYGASETSYISVAKKSDGAPRESVGRAFAGVEVQILSEDGTPLPAFAPGRLCVRSNLMFSGYLGAQADTRFTLQDGWASVGDHAYIDDRSFIYLVGRENRMIISGGRNIFPEEIETVLATHPTIEDCAVIGFDDARRGQALHAYLKIATPLSALDIKLWLKDRLQAYKIPHRFFVVEDLPKASTGKTSVDKLTRQSNGKEI